MTKDFVSSQTALKRLHLEHLGLSNELVKDLLATLIQSDAACQTVEELYLQGSELGREVSESLLELINTASGLRILDIRGKGRDPLNFGIQVVSPSEFIGPRREEDGAELHPSVQGSIEVVDAEEEGVVLHQAAFLR